ncbi:hypothetical protein [Streptomyces sp. NPDC054975]
MTGTISTVVPSRVDVPFLLLSSVLLHEPVDVAGRRAQSIEDQTPCLVVQLLRHFLLDLAGEPADLLTGVFLRASGRRRQRLPQEPAHPSHRPLYAAEHRTHIHLRFLP